MDLFKILNCDGQEICKVNSLSALEDKNLLFRGVSSINYKLVPSLYRIEDWDPKREKRILDTHKNEYPRKNLDCYFDTMAHARHYGKPTRLLDFTQNPFIALFFACQSNEDKDGVIYTSSVKTKKESENSYSFLNLRKILPSEIYSYTNMISTIDYNHSSQSEADNINQNMNIPNCKPISAEAVKPPCPYSLYLCPRIITQRQTAQKAVMLISTSQKEGQNYIPPDMHRLIIKKENKKDFLDKLKNEYDISKSSLFPDLTA